MKKKPTTKLVMSIPNDWTNHVIVHVSGNLWWNKTTDRKFYKVS